MSGDKRQTGEVDEMFLFPDLILRLKIRRTLLPLLLLLPNSLLLSSDFLDCRKKIVRAVGASSEDIRKKLGECDKKLSSLSLLDSCKLDAAQKYKDGRLLPENAMGYCRRLAEAMTFDEDKEVLAYPIAGRLFYAGTDLSETMELDISKKPFASCSPLALADPDEPRTEQGDHRLLDFLRFFQDGEASPPTRLASCSVGAKAGSPYSEHIFFFHIDPSFERATPLAVRSVLSLGYAESKASEDLPDSLAQKLGPNKKVVSSPGQKSFMISDAGQWTLFSQNMLCEKSLLDQEVAWVAWPAGPGDRAEVVVINRKSLCSSDYTQ